MNRDLLLVVCFSVFCVHGAPAESPPNIDYLFSDDQTAMAAGCYGNPEIKTPHLDRLAHDVVAGHGYDNYLVLFDRHLAWTEKMERLGQSTTSIRCKSR